MTTQDILLDARATLQPKAKPKGWIIHEAGEELEAASKTLENYQLVGSLVYANEVHILGGDDRSGKSKFAISILASMLRGKEIIPGFAMEANSPLACGVVDLELNAKTADKRHGKLLDEFKNQGRFYTIRPKASELTDVTDRVTAMLEMIEYAVNLTNINVLLFDNVLAWLGDDVSDNKIYMKLYYGLKAIIERRNNAGHICSLLLLMHITKSAQDRREDLGAAANSRRSDIRGAGAMQSTSASVMEIRQSGMDEEQAILIHYNTRHAKGENLAKHGRGYAFNVTHKPRDWAHEFIGVVELKNHFGKNFSQASTEVKNASRLDPSLAKAIKNLHSHGHSNSAIEKKIKEVYGKGSPDRKTVKKLLDASGLKTNGIQFGK